MRRLFSLPGAVPAMGLALMLAAVCLVPAPGDAAPLVRVGVEDFYPPFALTDVQGRHTGFDHEVAEALCLAMERPCEFTVLPFDDLLAAMQRGELDMIVASLAPSDERRAYMDFTDSYYRSRSIYIGRPNHTFISKEGLKGKKIGTQVDTMQAAFLRDQWGDVAEIVLASYEEILDKLCSGEVDVILVDGLPGYDFLKSERGRAFETLADPLPPDKLLSHARIGVRKGDDHLRETVNKAIARIRLNGDYDRITRKYFAFSIY